MSAKFAESTVDQPNKWQTSTLKFADFLCRLCNLCLWKFLQTFYLRNKIFTFRVISILWFSKTGAINENEVSTSHRLLNNFMGISENVEIVRNLNARHEIRSQGIKFWCNVSLYTSLHHHFSYGLSSSVSLYLSSILICNCYSGLPLNEHTFGPGRLSIISLTKVSLRLTTDSFQAEKSLNTPNSRRG